MGYYGGHVDTYIPYGEDLYYYDVNSLYPYAMKNYPMPCGRAFWVRDLVEEDLDSLFGFIEAYVICPCNMERPFLPYKNADGTVLFPTGKFVGVYFSEELKFARSLGYRIIPLRGYIFEGASCLFEKFVDDTYKNRAEARRSGNEPMAYIYKILMNSLYGRFGINAESTGTEICEESRYLEILHSDLALLYANKVSDRYYMVAYKTSVDSEDAWKPSRNAAVQLSAAVTAWARIHMYKWSSRPDCYYTDTDSVVLGSPLPDEEVTSELGKMKLEYRIKKGIFLAPKSDMLQTVDDQYVMRHKGAAKSYVDPEWFASQYRALSRTTTLDTESFFRIDWKNLNIAKKGMRLSIGTPINTKRENFYDENNTWTGTKPKKVIDLRHHRHFKALDKFIDENEGGMKI
jgi:hypothetical protein